MGKLAFHESSLSLDLRVVEPPCLVDACCCLLPLRKGAFLCFFVQVICGIGLLSYGAVTIHNDSLGSSGSGLGWMAIVYGIILLIYSSVLLTGLITIKESPLVMWKWSQLFCIAATSIIVMILYIVGIWQEATGLLVGLILNFYCYLVVRSYIFELTQPFLWDIPQKMYPSEPLPPYPQTPGRWSIDTLSPFATRRASVATNHLGNTFASNNLQNSFTSTTLRLPSARTNHPNRPATAAAHKIRLASAAYTGRTLLVAEPEVQASISRKTSLAPVHN